MAPGPLLFHPALAVSNNTVNSHPSRGEFNCRVLCSCLVHSAHTRLIELLCNGATLSLACRAMEPGHLLHSVLTRPSSANARRLKSIHPFVPAAQQLISLSDNNNIRAAQWVDYQWNAEWTDSPTRLRIFLPDTGTHPPNDSHKKSLGPA